MVNIKEIVLSKFREVAGEQRRTLAPLDDDRPLLECGLDSLCFAIVVVRLEDALGFDPFGLGDAVSFPVTLGDFIALYENHAA